MSIKSVAGIFLVGIFLSSCASSKIQGLWSVKRVQARSDEVVPQARWIRFDKQNNQESGNGWQKHSIGSWRFKKGMLEIQNSNSYKDEFEPFKVKFKKKGMEWSREEDGKKIRVYLDAIEAIPMSNRDRLLGVWDLKTVLENGQDRTLQYDPTDKRFLHIRWDNVFVDHHTPDNGSVSGIYQIGGQRDEIEMIFNKAELSRITWNYEVKEKRLVFTSTSEKDEIILEYIRLEYMPK